MRCLPLALVLAMTCRIAIADEFTQDFRNEQFNEANLRIAGSQNLLFREPEGIRVTIKKGSGESANTGVAFALQLAGDCRLQASVGLIDVPTPKGGYGTGVALLFEDGGPNGASFQNVVMPDGKHLYIAHKFKRSAEGEYKHEVKTFPATGTEAILAMERRGSQLKYIVSEDAGASFRELASYIYTADPLRISQAYAQVGGEPADVNIRITEFKVTAEKFLRPGEQAPKKPSSIQWLVVGLFIGLPVIGGIIWSVRRKSQARTMIEEFKQLQE